MPFKRLGIRERGNKHYLFGGLGEDTVTIREATEIDFAAIWPIFHDIVRAGETYTYTPHISQDDAKRLWMHVPRKTFVAEEAGEILGTYYIKTNYDGPGSHVCNCGYMVSSAAQGKGIATAMCRHSQQIARELGYKAMQFNSVVATNTRAVRLWNTLGYETVGRVPKAFHHPTEGYVDTLVMYKWLEGSQ